MRKNLSLTIAIPAYNEEQNIILTVETANFNAKKLTRNYEILVINDGSSDKTGEILNNLKSRFSHLKVSTHKNNLGIEPTLKDLYMLAKKDLIFFNGADNEIKMSILPSLIKKMDEGFDIIVAKRKVKKYNLFRKFVSWGFNFFTKLLFGVEVYDAGCAKLVKSCIYRSLDIKSTSVFAESERLIKASKAGYKIASVPVVHYPKAKPNQLDLKLVFASIKDMLLLLLRG